MRTILLTLLAFAGFITTSQARTITAVANGNWESASTWSPAAIPTNNDVVLVPNDKTVTVTGNINEKTSYMELRIAGTLSFTGGGAKLWLNAQSIVFVYTTGKINASQNSQVIIIGGTTVLQGPSTGTTTVTGPSLATSNSPSASSTSSATTTSAGFLPYNPSVLPVQFITFTATRKDDDVLVQWSTASEEGADRFDVEVSTDGRNWTSYGSVASAGNSTTVRNYDYSFRNSSVTLQVRIKQVDISGKLTYTAVRCLKAGAAASIKMSVVSGQLVLNFCTEVKDATIRVIGLGGQVLQEEKTASAIGAVHVPVSQKGICIVDVLSENEIVACQKVLL